MPQLASSAASSDASSSLARAFRSARFRRCFAAGPSTQHLHQHAHTSSTQKKYAPIARPMYSSTSLDKSSHTDESAVQKVTRYPVSVALALSEPVARGAPTTMKPAAMSSAVAKPTDVDASGALSDRAPCHSGTSSLVSKYAEPVSRTPINTWSNVDTMLEMRASSPSSRARRSGLRGIMLPWRGRKVSVVLPETTVTSTGSSSANRTSDRLVHDRTKVGTRSAGPIEWSDTPSGPAHMMVVSSMRAMVAGLVALGTGVRSLHGGTDRRDVTKHSPSSTPTSRSPSFRTEVTSTNSNSGS
mmetsp:Transcript_5505/g.17830  ORF Transcript_5505/g.17830 Transcript_5505/m.17830 type:complete len:300 (+) Transcript_5505:292-1191(+)